MAKSKSVKNLLNDAAKFLEKHRWTRWTEHDEKKDAYCAIGALRAVRKQGAYPYEVFASARAAAGHTAGVGLASYNDHYAGDKRYVVRLLRRAAKESTSI